MIDCTLTRPTTFTQDRMALTRWTPSNRGLTNLSFGMYPDGTPESKYISNPIRGGGTGHWFREGRFKGGDR